MMKKKEEDDVQVSWMECTGSRAGELDGMYRYPSRGRAGELDGM